MTDKELIAEFFKRFYNGGIGNDGEPSDFPQAFYDQVNYVAFKVAHQYLDDDGEITDDEEKGEKVYDTEGMAQDIASFLIAFTGRHFDVSIEECGPAMPTYTIEEN